MPVSFIPSRCEEVCSGVAVMGCRSDNVDYYFSAIQGRVGGGGRLSLLHHPSWYPLKTFIFIYNSVDDCCSMKVDQRILFLNYR